MQVCNVSLGDDDSPLSPSLHSISYLELKKTFTG
jgi:hypothetical protein